MKIKLFFLTIGAILLTYLIYNANTHQFLKVTTIYDDTTIIKENYNTQLKKSLNKIIDNEYYEYHKEKLEIENIVDKISANDSNIQEKLDSSNVVILYLGEFEILYEKSNIASIYEELEKLFILIRKYNSRQIIYISPVNLTSTYLIKDLCRKHKIEFINTSSLLNKYNPNNYTLTNKDNEIIANKLYNIITSTWKIDE